jgi:hypothetical protein
VPTHVLLTSGASTSNVTDYNPASITPGANRLITAYVLSSRGSSTDPVEPTMTGNGLTWVSMGSSIFQPAGTLRYRLTAFRALAASPSAGQPTISHSAAGTGCAWIIREWDSVDTSGTNGSGAAAQFKIAASSGAVASLTVTLDLAPTVGNAMDAAFAADGAPTFSAEAGWTESPATELTYATPSAMLGGMFRTDTDQSATGSVGTNATLGGAIVEIKAAGAAGVTLIPATESNAAQVLSFIKTIFNTLTPATSSEAAQALSFTKIIFKTLIPAVETNAAIALSFGGINEVTLTPATEIDAAQALNFTKTIFKTLTPATEIDSAQTVSYAQASSFTITPAVEIDVAQQLAVTKTIFKTLGIAVENDVAAAFTFTGGGVVPTIAHYDQPIPTGGIDEGSPTAGHYDQPTPGTVLA